jgi:hypothetical protein
MKTICAWCRKDMGVKLPTLESGDQVSYGICPTCQERMQKELVTMKINVEERQSLVLEK